MSSLIKPPRGILLNKAHPLARGLVGCWLMNEGVGEFVNDLSGFGNPGDTFAGVNKPTWVNEERSQALSFVTPGRIESSFLPIDVDAYYNDITITAVVKTHDQSASYAPYVITGADERDSSGVPFRFGIGVGQVVFMGPSNVNGATDTSDGEYHHVALAITSDYKAVYLDGFVDGTDSTANSGNIGSVNNWGLGYWNDDGTPGKYFEGEIDHIMIFNRYMSSDEIRLLAADPYQIFQRPLIIPAFAGAAGGITGNANVAAVTVAVPQPTGEIPITGTANVAAVTIAALQPTGAIPITGTVNTAAVTVAVSQPTGSTSLTGTANVAAVTVSVSQPTGAIPITSDVNIAAVTVAAPQPTGAIPITGTANVAAVTVAVPQATGTIGITGTVNVAAVTVAVAQGAGAIELTADVNAAAVTVAAAQLTGSVAGAVTQLDRIENLLYILLATKT